MSWASVLFPSWLFRPKIVLVLLFLATGALLVAFNYSYSDGNRAGYIQKFSKKGWFCKTHEGELAMTTVPGTAPLLWEFTVWDNTIAHQLSQQRADGHRCLETGGAQLCRQPRDDAMHARTR